MRACVYTAIYGDYDVLQEQTEQSVLTDFVCFTDSAGVCQSQIWKVIQNCERPELHPRMRAKYFKILSHLVFPKGMISRQLVTAAWPSHLYDYIIWIDGSIQIKSPLFVEMIVDHIPRRGLTMLKHPDRDCIYQEALASLWLQPVKYGKLPIIQQVESYRSRGYPPRNGLFAATIIGRRSRDKDLNLINNSWWAENVHWTYQDQLSLPFVLWQSGQCCIPINVSLWSNNYFDWRPNMHSRPD